MSAETESDVRLNSADGIKVALVGDSVIAGLGVHGRSYGRLTAECLGAAHVLRLARSTHTVVNARGHIDRLWEFNPDLIIMSVGGSDCLVHAGHAAQSLLDRLAPKSWQGIEGLEPRPWFSGEKAERRRQKVTGMLKLLLKHIGIALTGGYRRVPPKEFATALQHLLSSLDGMGARIVFVGLHELDDRLWPRSNDSICEYNQIIQSQLLQYPRIVFVDPNPHLDRWSDFCVDHAHFNERGHANVTRAILEALRPITLPTDVHDAVEAK